MDDYKCSPPFLNYFTAVRPILKKDFQVNPDVQLNCFIPVFFLRKCNKKNDTYTHSLKSSSPCSKWKKKKDIWCKTNSRWMKINIQGERGAARDGIWWVQMKGGCSAGTR